MWLEKTSRIHAVRKRAERSTKQQGSLWPTPPQRPATGQEYMSCSKIEKTSHHQKHIRPVSGDFLSMSMGQLRVVCSQDASSLGERSQETDKLVAGTADVTQTFLVPRAASALTPSPSLAPKHVSRSAVTGSLDLCRSSLTSAKSDACGAEAMEDGIPQRSLERTPEGAPGGTPEGSKDRGSASECCGDACLMDSCRSTTVAGEKEGAVGRSLVELFKEPALVLAADGAVMHWNRAFLSLLGIKGMSIPGRKAFPQDFLLGQSGNSASHVSLTLRGEDSSPVPVSVTYQKTEILGEGMQLATLRDLSKELQHEEERREAKAVLEGAVKVKTQFLDKMSHELRTPLNGVVGVVDLLLGSTQVSTEQQAYLATIRTSAEMLLSVLSDILDMCDVESSRIAIRPQVFSLHGLIQEATCILSSLASAKQLQVCTCVAEDVPQLAEGDSQRMLQILRHLISNAVKFTSQGFVSFAVSRAPPPANADAADNASPSGDTAPSPTPGTSAEGRKLPRHCTTCACSKAAAPPVADISTDGLTGAPALVSRKRSLDSAMETESMEGLEEMPRKVPRVGEEGSVDRGVEEKGPSSRAAEEGAAASPEYVQFVVKDSGMGFREVDLDRIFQPFVQGDDSHSRVATGAGLGLAITRSLVASMGGKIQVASLPGRGSVFTVILPIKSASTPCSTPEPSASKQSPPSPLSTKSCLGRLHSPIQGIVSWIGAPPVQGTTCGVSRRPSSRSAPSSNHPCLSQSHPGSPINKDEVVTSDWSGECRPRMRALSTSIMEDRPGLADLLASCQGGGGPPNSHVMRQSERRDVLSSSPLHPLDCRRPGMVASMRKVRAQSAASSEGSAGAPTAQRRSGLQDFVESQDRTKAPASGASPMAVERTQGLSADTDVRVAGSPPCGNLGFPLRAPPPLERKVTTQLEQALATVPGKLRSKFLQPWVAERVQSLRCLIAEDNPVNRMVLQRMLRLVDLSCDHAKNGAEAVQAVQAKNYDIVFMDCQMPVMDGFEASRAIRGAKPRSCTRTQALCGGPVTKSTEGLDLSFSVLRKTPVPGLAPRDTLATGKLRLSSGADVTFEHHSSNTVPHAGQGGHGAVGEDSMMDIFRITCKPSLEVDLGAGCSQGSCFWGSCECCPTVIAVTANVLQGSPGRCREAGMNGFIAKPVRLADVLHVLLRCMGVEP